MKGITIITSGEQYYPNNWDENNVPVGSKIRFDSDNNFGFVQDFGFWADVPCDVIFELDKWIDNGMCLKAPGYGGKPYGNGSIMVWRKQELCQDAIREDENLIHFTAN